MSAISSQREYFYLAEEHISLHMKNDMHSSGVLTGNCGDFFCVSAEIFNSAMSEIYIFVKVREKKPWISQSHLRSSDFHVRITYNKH